MYKNIHKLSTPCSPPIPKGSPRDKAYASGLVIGRGEKRLLEVFAEETAQLVNLGEVGFHQ